MVLFQKRDNYMVRSRMRERKREERKRTRKTDGRCSVLGKFEFI